MWLILNVVPISVVQQSDSVIYAYLFFFNTLSILLITGYWIYSPVLSFRILFPIHSKLTVCIYQIPSPSLSLPTSPLMKQKAQLFCALVSNQISEAEFQMKSKRIFFFFFFFFFGQAKGDTASSCFRKKPKNKQQKKRPPLERRVRSDGSTKARSVHGCSSDGLMVR